ncbi:furry [Wolffia australiana]
MASAPSSTPAAKSFFQVLRSFIKKPWEITGPCAHPEYRNAVPGALEYRRFCPATVPGKAIVPTSDPETVFDIKYFTRDQRRNRPPIRRTVLKKADVEQLMKEKTFNLGDFPPVYLTHRVEEDGNTLGGGYQS